MVGTKVVLITEPKKEYKPLKGSKSIFLTAKPTTASFLKCCNLLNINKLRHDSCGPVQNRTGIQGFGDPYTIHCTTGPILLPERWVKTAFTLKGWQNYELFQQSPQVSAEYFNSNSQENNSKKLPDGDHPGRPQYLFNKVQGFEHNKNEDQVEENAQQYSCRVIVGFERHDRGQRTRTGYQREGNRNDHIGFRIRLAFKKLDTQHHSHPQDKNNIGTPYAKTSPLTPSYFINRLSTKTKDSHIPP